jgi:hypothetical protein
MTTLLDIERPAILFADGAKNARLAAGRRPRTLDQAISGVWEDLTVRQTATACLICGSAMLPYGEGDGGACTSCGTSLG